MANPTIAKEDLEASKDKLLGAEETQLNVQTGNRMDLLA